MDNNTTFLIILWVLRFSCVAFLIIAWKNLKWGIFLVCAFLPAYLIRFKAPLDIPMTALELMILILFGVWIIKKLRNYLPVGDKRSPSYALRVSGQSPSYALRVSGGNNKITKILKKNKLLIIGAGLFLISATISMIFSPDLRTAAGIWKAYFIEPFLFFLVFITTIKKKDLKWVFYSLGFSAFYISIYAIGQKFFGLPIPTPWQEETRVTSIFPFPNAVGLFLAPLIPLFFYQLIANYQLLITKKIPDLRFKIYNSLVNLFWSITIVLSLFSIYFAKTEGALVALAVGLFLYLFIKFKKRGKILITAFVLTAVVAILFLNFTPFPQIKEKLLLQDWSGMVRKTIWVETLEMLKNNPILGAGLSGYQAAIVPYHKSANWMEIFLYPHNVIFNFWSEIGIFGLLGFIVMIIFFYFENWKLIIENSKNKNISLLSLSLIVGITVLLIHGLVDVPYFKNDLSVLFWILIGILLVLRKNE